LRGSREERWRCDRKGNRSPRREIDGGGSVAGTRAGKTVCTRQPPNPTSKRNISAWSSQFYSSISVSPHPSTSKSQTLYQPPPVGPTYQPHLPPRNRSLSPPSFHSAARTPSPSVAPPPAPPRVAAPPALASRPFPDPLFRLQIERPLLQQSSLFRLQIKWLLLQLRLAAGLAISGLRAPNGDPLAAELLRATDPGAGRSPCGRCAWRPGGCSELSGGSELPLALWPAHVEAGGLQRARRGLGAPLHRLVAAAVSSRFQADREHQTTFLHLPCPYHSSPPRSPDRPSLPLGGTGSRGGHHC
jgi:hypothetical protein